jgi:acetylornithine/succinyldiaminopimelate/putrescine aminotransferase
VTAGGQEKYQHGFEPLVPGVRHVPFGDVAALDAALDERTAAFLVEPLQGESGVVPAPEGYLEAARELTRRRGALLCLDEVQTGMGRTGKMWAHEWTSVLPDVISTAKAPVIMAGNGVIRERASDRRAANSQATPSATIIGSSPARNIPLVDTCWAPT